MEIDWTERHSEDTKDDDDDDITSGDGKTSDENGIDSSTVDVVDGGGGGDSISDANTSDEESKDFPIILPDCATSDKAAIAFVTPSHSRSQAVSSDRNVHTKSGSLREMSAPPCSLSSSTASERQKTNNMSLNDRERRHIRQLTTFRAHGQCGHHRLSVIARDPHPRSDCIIYHSQTYDRREGREYSDKKTYFMPASGTLLAASLGSSSTKKKKHKTVSTECMGDQPTKTEEEKTKVTSQEQENCNKIDKL